MANEFDILIKFGLSKEKATEAVQELKKVEEQTKKNTAAGTTGAKEVEQATEKVTNSTKTWRDGIRGVAAQFPMLGRFAALALNPISATVALATGAFVALKNVVDNTVRSLGGVALPDASESHVERILRYANNLLEVGKSARQANTDLKAHQAVLKDQADFLKALGIDPGLAPAEAAANLASQTAQALRRRGEANQAAGAQISDADLDKLKNQAVEAEAQLGPYGDQIERRTFLDRMRTDGSVGANMEFVRRYGFTTTVDEALSAENALRDRAQSARGQYETALTRRNLFTLGQSQVSDANSIFGEATGARRQIEIQAAGRVSAATQNITGNIASLPSEMATLFQTLMDLQRVTQASMREAQNAKRVSDQQQ